jgi:hypothetical protein
MLPLSCNAYFIKSEILRMRQALTYKTFKAYMAYVKNRLKHAREK